MTSRIPAEVFPPGEYIRDLLESRDWTQADLAEILGRPVQVVNEIIVGKKAVTPETAQALGEAFGTGPDFWLNLESAFRLSLSRTTGGDVARRARLYGLAPIKDMIKRRWIEPSDSLDVLEREVLSFFQIGSFDEKPICKFAAKKSGSYSDVMPAQMAWYFRGRTLAESVVAPAFDENRFVAGLADLRRLAKTESDLRKVPGLLSAWGIRLVVVEHLSSTKLDGAAFWLADDRPVIILSLRYDRIDNFWFVLCHELAHIKNRDPGSIDNDLMDTSSDPNADKPEFERVADRMAAHLIIPKGHLEKFMALHRPRYSKKAIAAFADSIGVHPGIVVGQLQHRKEIGYAHSREMLASVRDAITKNTLTDGWGKTPR